MSREADLKKGDLSRDKFHHQIIYWPCDICGKPRWAPFVKEQPRAKLCQRCSMNTPEYLNNPKMRGGHRQTEMTKLKISQAQKGVPGLSGDKHPLWSGGRTITPSGYVKLYKPDHPKAINNYVLEHRLVMEQTIGRFLWGNEIVHHLNGNKIDNRPENLAVLTNSEHHSLALPYIKRIKELEMIIVQLKRELSNKNA